MNHVTWRNNFYLIPVAFILCAKTKESYFSAVAMAEGDTIYMWFNFEENMKRKSTKNTLMITNWHFVLKDQRNFTAFYMYIIVESSLFLAFPPTVRTLC